MKRYAEYKDSGVAWLGDIPVSWDIIMAKHVVSINHGSDPKSEGDIPVYGSGAGSFKTCGEYKEGPIVLVGRKGATLHIPHYIEGKYWNVDTAFDVKSKEGTILIKLYYYLAQCFDYRYYISQTTLPSMTQSDYCEMKLPIPDIIEQRGIVEYLDSIVAYIDNLIDEAKASIEEYKAWKASIIYEAVTKGLDKDVEMKDSGVNWIGKIPSGWKISSVRHLLSVLTDYTANGSFGDLAKNVTYLEQGYARVVRLTDLRVGFANDGIYVDKHAYDYLSKSSLFGGEILLANVGAYAGLAMEMPHINVIATLGPNMFLIKTIEELWHSHYAYYSLISESCAAQLRMAANKTTAQPKINKEDLRGIKTVLPSVAEQDRIAAYLDSVCNEIDALISEKESLVSDLEAYKKSLIFEVVTGKRKVV